METLAASMLDSSALEISKHYRLIHQQLIRVDVSTDGTYSIDWEDEAVKAKIQDNIQVLMKGCKCKTGCRCGCKVIIVDLGVSVQDVTMYLNNNRSDQTLPVLMKTIVMTQTTNKVPIVTPQKMINCNHYRIDNYDII